MTLFGVDVWLNFDIIIIIIITNYIGKLLLLEKVVHFIVQHTKVIKYM